MLEEARGRIDDWPLERDSFAALSEGLERTYRRGRRDFGAAAAEREREALHEWRKRAKELWYHPRCCGALWPPVMEAFGDEAHELSDRLGDDHDLAMLADWVAEHIEPGPSSSTRWRAAARELQADAFDARRAAIRREALGLRPAHRAPMGRRPGRS